MGRCRGENDKKQLASSTPLKSPFMKLKYYQELFERDLKRVKTELSAYTDEDLIWVTTKEINNCTGNLILHVIGNLNWFIGAQLGNTGYERQRDLEFSGKDIARADLQAGLDKTIDTIEESLNRLDESDLNERYPIDVFERATNVGYFLTHLYAHLNYHLGQINYHRRLISADDLSVEKS